MIGAACGNCGGTVDQLDSHLAECLETIGELYCAECWEEMEEANRAYDAEDSV